MARDNALWLGRGGLVARTVTIKVCYSDFTTVTRSHAHDATGDPEAIVRRAVALLDKPRPGGGRCGCWGRVCTIWRRRD